jgi:hypothetical protein
LIEVAQRIGDAMLAPFVWMPPLAAIVALSVVSGLLFLLAFRAVSPRDRLRRVKELMSATIYEMRIFASFPRRVLAAQGRALALTVVYLVLALPALVLLFPPLAVLLARAATHYEYRPLRVGEVAMVTVDLDRQAADVAVELRPDGSGLAVLRPVVQVRSRARAYARVRAMKPGAHRIRVKVGEQLLDKSVRVEAPGGASPGPVSLFRGGGLAALLSHEPALPDGSHVQSLAVDYPQRDETWLAMPWYVLMLAISLVVAFALRRRLGVVF